MRPARARQRIWMSCSSFRQLPRTVALWRDHPRVLALREESRTRLVRLVAAHRQWLREGRVSEEAAVRIADWIEPLLRRESYLALLLERPTVHERLLRLLGGALAGALPAQTPRRDRRTGWRRTCWPSALWRLISSASWNPAQPRCRSTGEDDDEALLNLLRRAHHAEVFRTLARDVEAG
jgi:glutamate-ammonia-ligase adenylyltransferase